VAVIAVDCGGTNLTAGWVERAGTPQRLVTVPTPATAGAIPETILQLMAALPPAAGVGIGIAGLVDHSTGSLLWMPHRPGSTPVGAAVAAGCGLPTSVDNDANVTALAEAVAGAGVGHRVVLAVTVGTGIGGGLVIDETVERGRGHLGEIGHMTVDRDGRRCACGSRGCWEEVASGRALDRAAAALGLGDGIALVEAGAAGDAEAAAGVAAVGAAFGHGLASLVAILDPDVIVVGGGVVSAGEAFLAPARQALADVLSGVGQRWPTPVLPARFGSAAGIVGAALMAGAPR